MSRKLTRLSGAGAIVIAFGLVAGCQGSDPPVSPQSQGSRDAALPLTESRVLLEPATMAPALRGALSVPNVAAARIMLETEGYTYVEANSLVLIHTVRDFLPETFDAASDRPSPPRDRSRAGGERVDTVVWLAFENPTHDLANHTAVLYFSNAILSRTFLIELDISTETPEVIRQGFFEDGEWNDQDIGTEAWFSCVLGGSAGAAVGCAYSNCGYGHCVAVGVGASLVGCTASALWDWATS
jgi:hypothetical protein